MHKINLILHEAGTDPFRRVVGTSTSKPLNGWTEQKFTLSSDGTMRIDKFDHHLIRGAYEQFGTLDQ